MKITQRLKELERVKKIQCMDGNWNYNPYMFGFANGLILALSILKNEEADLLDAPNEWLFEKRHGKTEISEPEIQEANKK